MSDASVRVVVNAVVDQAQEAMESTADEVMQVGASATTAQSGLDALERSLDSAGRSAVTARGAIGSLGGKALKQTPGLWALQSAIDEVGDELDHTAAKAVVAGGAMTTAAGGASALGLSSWAAASAVSALKFALIGLMGLGLLPVIVPVAGALGGIATAFGAIVGSGFLAWGDGAKKTLKKVKNEIIAIVKPFGQQFVPLLKDAVLALPDLVKSLIKALGPMGKFKQALRDFGAWAMRVLPKVVAWMVDLGRKSLPLLRKLGKFIEEDLVPALKKTTEQTSPLKDDFIALGKAIVKATPHLIKIGIFLLEHVVPALAKLTSWLGKGAKWFNKLSGPVQKVILGVTGLIAVLAPVIAAIKLAVAVLAPLWSAFTTVAGAIGTLVAAFNPLTLAIAAIVAVIVGLAYTVYTNWDKIKRYTSILVDKVVGFLTGLKKDATRAVNNLVDRATSLIKGLKKDATRTVNNLVSDVKSTWSNGWDNVEQSLSTAVDNIVDEVKGLKKDAEREVDNALGNIDDTVKNWNIKQRFSNAISRGVTAVENAVSDFEDAGEDLIDAIVDGIENAPNAVGNAVENAVGGAADYIPSSDAKKGPLSDLTASGEALPETLAKGMLASERAVRRAASQMAATAMPQLAVGGAGGAGGGGGGGVHIDMSVDASGRDDGEEIAEDISDGLYSEMRSLGMD